MIKYIRTNSDNEDFQHLVEQLDADLRIRDGADHAFYAQFNKLKNIIYVIVAYQENVPVGCGAIKEYAAEIIEIKRMFVPLNKRKMGIASNILSELEKWAKELNFKRCILETGINQPEAIALYKKNKYSIIPNYGQYEKVETSVCFEKIIS